jgi:hypothetical protein
MQPGFLLQKDMPMGFLKKKIPLGWAIVLATLPAIGWLLQFLFGTGAFWEWRRMDLVTLEVGRGLAELYQKKAAALEDVLRPEVVALPSDSDVWKTKMEYLNAMEKSIAQLEGRKPVVYARPGPITNFGVRDSPGGGRIGVR